MPNNNPTGKNQYSNRKSGTQQPKQTEGMPHEQTPSGQRIPDSD